jgi:hypothetical protein
MITGFAKFPRRGNHGMMARSEFVLSSNNLAQYMMPKPHPLEAHCGSIPCVDFGKL